MTANRSNAQARPTTNGFEIELPADVEVAVRDFPDGTPVKEERERVSRTGSSTGTTAHSTICASSVAAPMSRGDRAVSQRPTTRVDRRGGVVPKTQCSSNPVLFGKHFR